MSKRIKIATFYPTNLFYEKVLIDWKANSSDKRGSYIIKKALDNLKSYPVELGGYTDLRKIKGIGEDIATRLDAACQYFREREGGLTLQKVRALKKGQAIPYLREAAVTKGKKFVPFISRDVFNSPGIQLGTLADAGPSTSSRPPPVIPSSQAPTTSNNVNLNRSFSQPTIPTFEEAVVNVQPLSQAIDIRPRIAAIIPKPKKNVVNDKLLEYDPAKHAHAELVLIVDGREVRSGGGRTKVVGDHLTKRSVIHEMRPLVVGDYLWVVKLGAGQENELVLDYVVERKTWDDLKQSIRHSRYAEQKQRLRQSGIKNIVLVAEGSDNNVDRSLEQALATSSLENGFLIHRTPNLAGTAVFLDDLTKHMRARLKKEKFEGHSFDWHQDESRKTKEISVSDCFLRQLTVCPQVSAAKANEIIQRFPSFRALHRLYKNSEHPIETTLSSAIPTIPFGVSKQMGMFFKSQHPTYSTSL